MACARCPAPTWRSCWRWPTCWPPNRWPTAISWTPTAPATSASSATCSVSTTACPSRRSGRRQICGLPADDLTALARRMAAARTIVTVSWSLQRIRHGEQAPWMGLTLAAMLGQIGLPGGGFGHGYGSMNEPGLPPLRCPAAVTAAGPQPGADVHPGRGDQRHAAASRRAVRLQRARLTYPDIKLVYWAGGNPFHHHQNIPRLRRALGRVDTVVVHDPYWTAMAKHADIVVPSTTAFERDDYSGSRNDPLLMAMPALAEPYARIPRRLHDIRGAGRAARVRRAVHRGPHRAAVAGAPVRQVGGRTGFRGADVRRVLGGWAGCGCPPSGLTLLADFRADPDAHRLTTPSGRIEIFSDRHRRLRLRRLRRAPDVVRADGVARRAAGRAVSAAPAGQPARHAAAQPARWRRHQPGVESARARTDPDAPARCRGARTWPTVTWCGCSTTAAPAWRAW